MEPKLVRPETIAAQALGWIDERTRAITPPIHVSSTYLRDADNLPGKEATRNKIEIKSGIKNSYREKKEFNLLCIQNSNYFGWLANT